MPDASTPYNIPDHDCRLCPRLAEFRDENKQKFPDKFNAPVPAFGNIDAPFLITGLAPGLKGANFSGRPFTGDYAGDLLYATLLKLGLAEGEYKARPDDGLTLKNCRISNAVKCVPPANKPETQEIKTCLQFIKSEIQAMKNLKVILTLGLIAHQAVLRSFDLKPTAYKFGHAMKHDLGEGVTMINSYHCSRYNTQTKRLTTEMFEDVVDMCAGYIS